MSATSPAPVNAPAMRAESCVVRWMPIAAISCAVGMMSPTTAAAHADIRRAHEPDSARDDEYVHGVTMPLNVETISVVASVAYAARIAHSILRWPMRSPITPNIGARNVPMYCSDETSRAASPIASRPGCTSRESASPFRTPTRSPCRRATGSGSCGSGMARVRKLLKIHSRRARAMLASCFSSRHYHSIADF